MTASVFKDPLRQERVRNAACVLAARLRVGFADIFLCPAPDIPPEAFNLTDLTVYILRQIIFLAR